MKKFIVEKWREKPYDLKFVLLFSFLIKIILLILATDKVFNRDGILYISAAQQILLGNFKEALSLYPMPFYPALITAVHFIFPDWVLSARIISSASFFLSAIPLYLITKELFNKESAFWAASAFSVAPVINLYGLEGIRGPLFIFMLSYGAYFAFLSIRNKKISYFIGTFLFAWIAMLCRVEAVVFYIFYFLSLIFFAIIYPADRKYFIKLALLWVIIPAIFFLIAVFFLGYSDSSSINRFGDILAVLKEVLSLDFLGRYDRICNFLINLKGAEPFSRFGQGFADTSSTYLFLIYFISIIDGIIKDFCPLFCIPLFISRKFPKNRFTYFFIALIASYAASSYLFLVIRDYLTSRYLFPAAFFTFPFIGFGFNLMFRKITKFKQPKKYFIILLFIFFILPTVKSISYFINNDSSIIKAGKWLASQNLPETANIATSEKRIAFYADKLNVSDSRSYKTYDKDMAKQIKEKSMDVIVIEHSAKRDSDFVISDNYKKIKTFKGKEDVVIIYYSDEFLKKQKR